MKRDYEYVTRKKWVRTDWDQTAAVGIGIGGSIFMTTCFYLLFTLVLPGA